MLADAALLAMENETKRCPAVREWLAMAAAELIYWDAVSGVDQAGGAADPNNPPEEVRRRLVEIPRRTAEHSGVLAKSS